jgi:hypothetical protein
MKIRKCRKKYVVIVNRRSNCIYLTRDNSEFYYSSSSGLPSWRCNFQKAKELINQGIKIGLTFSVVK